MPVAKGNLVKHYFFLSDARVFLSVCEMSFGQKVRKDEIIMRVIDAHEVWRREDEDFSP